MIKNRTDILSNTSQFNSCPHKFTSYLYLNLFTYTLNARKSRYEIHYVADLNSGPVNVVKLQGSISVENLSNLMPVRVTVNYEFTTGLKNFKKNVNRLYKVFTVCFRAPALYDKYQRGIIFFLNRSKRIYFPIM